MQNQHTPNNMEALLAHQRTAQPAREAVDLGCRKSTEVGTALWIRKLDEAGADARNTIPQEADFAAVYGADARSQTKAWEDKNPGALDDPRAGRVVEDMRAHGLTTGWKNDPFKIDMRWTNRKSSFGDKLNVALNDCGFAIDGAFGEEEEYRAYPNKNNLGMAIWLNGEVHAEGYYCLDIGGETVGLGNTGAAVYFYDQSLATQYKVGAVGNVHSGLMGMVVRLIHDSWGKVASDGQGLQWRLYKVTKIPGRGRCGVKARLKGG